MAIIKNIAAIKENPVQRELAPPVMSQHITQQQQQ